MRLKAASKPAAVSLQDALKTFRATHPLRHLQVAGRHWQFIACGEGENTAVLLPRAVGSAEEWFLVILSLEADRRIIAPTYPLARTMSQLVDGVAAILEDENVAHADFVGVDFGACVAQCFARAFPQMVRKLALDGDVVPEKSRTAALKCRDKMLHWLPMRLLRHLERRSVRYHLSTMPQAQRDFWGAYLNESINVGLTRQRLLMQNDCLIDFHEHYSPASPNDPTDAHPTVVSASELPDEPAFFALTE